MTSQEVQAATGVCIYFTSSPNCSYNLIILFIFSAWHLHLSKHPHLSSLHCVINSQLSFMQPILPSPGLKPFVKAYRIIESVAGTINRILPDTSVAMAFRYQGEIGYVTESGKIQLPIATLSGLRKSARLINYAPNSAAFIVIFKEAAASSFLREPAHHLFGESVALDNFFSQSEILCVEEKLALAVNHHERVKIVEEFLYARVQQKQPDLLVAEAISRIRNNRGIIKVSNLANSLAISKDAFEKRFRKTTGASPKQFASIVRLKSLIENKSAHSSLLDLAFNHGYYDQAHFSKDFKLFTGQTPSEFFRSSLFW